MQHGIAIVGGSHLCNLFSSGDPIAFSDQDLSVVPVGTQVVIVMFDDDKPPIANQSTTAIDDLSALGCQDRLPGSTGDLYSLAQRVTGLEFRYDLAIHRPPP